ncbi:MAG: signal peptide peptidase SppA [Candidatus Aminicenantes bacterium]|nr:signal peptide peptidase SppA [Candidatus Aminicenantes bacterium]
MKKGRSVLLLVLIFAGLILAAAVSWVFMTLRSEPVVPEAAVLEIRVEGPLAEFADPGALAALFAGRPQSMLDIWNGLRLARADRRVTGVLLRLGLLDCDWAKCAEIRDAVLDFRRSGKKAVAYFEDAPLATKEYYIATACDRIVLHPLGGLGITGLGGQVPFFKNALDKLGIRAEIEHIEEYKTAYNQFTEKGFTPAHREMTESLLADQFDHFLKDVAAARGKSEPEIRALVDRALFRGEDAVRAGLVDECLYEDQVRALFGRQGRPAVLIPISRYSRISPSSVGLGRGRRLALLYAVGPIHGGESLAGTIGSDTLGRWLREAREDSAIAAVVLRVDSPGGAAVASDVIAREVELTRAVKPIVVSMSDVAGSGGYWIAMGASRIVAQPQTLTGSIGVLAGKIDASGLLAKLGIGSETVRFGRFADLYSPFRPATAEERVLLKADIRWIYERFVAKAAAGRHLAPEQIDRLGRGRVWTGAQAKARGLVDELGGLSKAIEIAKALAGIGPEEDVRLAVRPGRTSFLGALFGRRGADARTGLTAEMERAAGFLKMLGRNQVLAIVPF